MGATQIAGEERVQLVNRLPDVAHQPGIAKSRQTFVDHSPRWPALDLFRHHFQMTSDGVSLMQSDQDQQWLPVCWQAFRGKSEGGGQRCFGFVF